MYRCVGEGQKTFGKFATHLRPFRFFWLILLVPAFLAPPRALAANPSDKLSEIQSKLKDVWENVRESKAEEKNIRGRIDNLSEDIAQKEKELKNVDKKLSETQSDIQSLSTDINVRAEVLESRKDHLRKYLRSLYGRKQNGIDSFVLFTATDYQDLIRKSKYISLLASYEGRIIGNYSNDIHEIDHRKKKLEEMLQNLESTKNIARQKKNQLQSDRAVKAEVLAAVQNEREKYEKRVRALEDSSKKIQTMIGDLKAKAIPAAITGRGFASLKGTLPWPVQGKIVVPYGKYVDPEYHVPVFKRGIEIAASPGDIPKAVAGGRVVYAAGFDGYGTVMIIDHGNGYHSLYRNLSEVFFKEGELLISGQELGKVGSPDPSSESTLYFEIRYRGKPIDPMGWLKRTS